MITAAAGCQVLVTEANVLCMAYLAPPPDVPPYQLSGDHEPIDIYYISLSVLYHTLWGGIQLKLAVHMNSDVQLFIRAGPRAFEMVSTERIDAENISSRDLYVSYKDCIGVMRCFLSQIATLVDPEIAEIHNKSLSDHDLVSTMYWVQNLERATHYTVRKYAGLEAENPVMMTNKRYNELSLPYTYHLYTQRLTHASILKSKHPVAKRQTFPFMAFCIEGYILYASSEMNKYDIYRTEIMQSCLILNLNHTMLCRVDELGAQLVREEEEEARVLKQRCENKRSKKQRQRQRKQEARALAASASTLASATASTIESTPATASAEKENVIPTTMGLSPHAPIFVPTTDSIDVDDEDDNISVIFIM